MKALELFEAYQKARTAHFHAVLDRNLKGAPLSELQAAEAAWKAAESAMVEELNRLDKLHPGA